MDMSRLLLAIAAMATVAACGCRPGAVGQRWPDPGSKLTCSARVSAEGGIARHRESSNLQPMKSEWDASVARTRLLVDLRTRPGVEFSAEASAFLTDVRDEDWEYDGWKVSEDQLKMSGWEWRALAGWGVDFEGFGRVSLLGGLAGRSVTLDRRFHGGDRDAQKTDMVLWEVEGRMVLPLRKDLLDQPVKLELSTSYGRLLTPEADVEGAGTIEGDYGWLWRVRTGFDFRLTDRTSFYLGGFYEILRIEGGTEGTYEWPDSETTAAGGEIGLRVSF
jgi:opacity protein-like surface antigen